ncbi:GGDEF domain-containing protein [Deinococcus arcticus]|uniref:GGDEF domain-containing protein n=1 Tax=Deinococcus arcticus TaxID=2136176 RepID=A0A2T3WD53_9DEIO|nr:GGDEF domain-containing protein [Deinococcus arcticus]PTA69829.1 hypothetical protein C8263_02140 [Deinococcus arcticus]
MQRETGEPSLSERQQRNFMSALAALAVLMQTATSMHLHTQPEQLARALQADLGLGFAVLLLVLTRVQAIRLGTLQKLVVGAVATWLLLNVISVFRTARPITSGLLIHMVLLALFAYTWLPARAAALIVTPAYLLLAAGATFSRAPDLPGLLLTGLVLPLTWYLTVHGRIVSGERARSVELAALAATDPLTGCLNRRSGHSQLLALADTWAAQPERLSVALCDIDHFKRVNDTWGHEQGDEALARVAQTLRAQVRAGDLVVRWGGEEFLLVLADLRPAEASTVLERTLRGVRALELAPALGVTLSAGHATLAEAPDITALLRLADQRLFAAKAAGRDQLCSGPEAPGDTGAATRA